MKILITGAAGFIGSYVTEKLISLGNDVTGIDNFDPFYKKQIKESNLQKSLSSQRFKFIEGSINDISSLLKNEEDRYDVVIHLAAKAGVRPSIENPAAYIDTNILGTFSVLEWMKAGHCNNLIFASSSSVYGNNRKTPFSESDAVDHPISPYAFTKKSCELMNFNYHHLYDLNIINLRFFTVYGPRQRPDLAIHKFFDQIYRNDPLSIFGDGSTGRDYTYIDDIVNGIHNSIELIGLKRKKIFDTFNLGNSSPVLLRDLITWIEKISGRKAVIKNLPMQEGDVDLTFADISKAKKNLKYQPHVKLEEGLSRFKEWYEISNMKLASS
jgi:UDP-glucuronate 4-epimerase